MKKIGILFAISVCVVGLTACNASNPLITTAETAACKDIFKTASKTALCVTAAGAAISVAKAYQTYQQTGAAP